MFVQLGSNWHALEESYGQPFRWNERTSRPDIDQNTMLAYAIKCHEWFGEGNRYAHRVFAAGMIFDILRMYADIRLKERKKPVVEYLDRVFNHGDTTARVLHGLSKRMKQLELAEFALSAAILHDVGKAVIAIFDPEYVELATAAEKGKISRSLWITAEEKRYRLSHPHMGYLVCESFSMFAPIAKAVLFHHDPYILKTRKQTELFDVASTVSLSTNIVRSAMKLPTDAAINSKYANEQGVTNAEKANEESVRKYWMRAELDEHSLPPLEIYKIIQSLKKG